MRPGRIDRRVYLGPPDFAGLPGAQTEHLATEAGLLGAQWIYR